MASDDKFFNLIGSQAFFDPEMKRLLASTEGVLHEQPPTQTHQEHQPTPVAQLVVFNNNQMMLQIGEDANPDILLASLHHAIEVVRERFQSNED